MLSEVAPSLARVRAGRRAGMQRLVRSVGAMRSPGAPGGLLPLAVAALVAAAAAAAADDSGVPSPPLGK